MQSAFTKWPFDVNRWNQGDDAIRLAAAYLRLVDHGHVKLYCSHQDLLRIIFLVSSIWPPASFVTSIRRQ